MVTTKALIKYFWHSAPTLFMDGAIQINYFKFWK